MPRAAFSRCRKQYSEVGCVLGFAQTCTFEASRRGLRLTCRLSSKCSGLYDQYPMTSSPQKPTSTQSYKVSFKVHFKVCIGKKFSMPKFILLSSYQFQHIKMPSTSWKKSIYPYKYFETQKLRNQKGQIYPNSKLMYLHLTIILLYYTIL